MQSRLLAAAAAILVASATLATAGDKALSSMNQPFVLGAAPPALVGPLALSWVPASTGKMKLLPSCKVSVKLAGTTVPNSDGVPGSGDEVLCLIEFNHTVVGGPAGLVLRGEVNNGRVTILADLPAEGLGGVLCGGGNMFSDLRSTCYEPDGAYAPVLTVGFLSDPTQGLIAPVYPPRPATGLMATDSVSY